MIFDRNHIVAKQNFESYRDKSGKNLLITV